MAKNIFNFATLIAAASILGGCNSLTTYGTGEDQQLASIRGLAAIGTKRETMDVEGMENRAGLVMPPSTGEALPSPQSQSDQMVALGFTDPNDARFEEIMADGVITREERNSLKLPDGYVPPKSARTEYDMTDRADVQRRLRNINNAAKESQQAQLDENGLPTRQFLTDPPSELLVPSGDAPVEFTNEELKAAEPDKKSFLWRIFND